MFPPTHLHLNVFFKSGNDRASKDIIPFRAGESLTSPALQLETRRPAWDLAPLLWQSELAQLVHGLMKELWPWET